MKATDLRHVRPVQPLRFPTSNPEWEMPESQRHKRMCELVYQILAHALAPEHAVASDLFVYFDASDERRCTAPDAFVKFHHPHDPHSDKSWLVWERGAPELAVEILSPSDTKEPLTWKEKMERYHALGVLELVSFNADEDPGKRVRAWDRIEGDLVERVVQNETTPCLTLTAILRKRVNWVLAPADDVSLGLRLDSSDGLLPTPVEHERAAKERAIAELEMLRAKIERREK